MRAPPNNLPASPPGYSERDGNINYKTYTGDIYAAAINDGRYALPSDSYLKDDHRMVMKDAGRFVCIPDAATGAHGDTFDSGKIAELILMAGGGINAESVKQIRTGGNAGARVFVPRHFTPRRLA